MSTLLEDIDADDLKAFLSSRGCKYKKAKTAHSKSVCFLTFLSMPTITPTKPLLPISIDTHLPHFKVVVGQKGSNSPFKISQVYDMWAITNVGWSTYITWQSPSNTHSSSRA